eukprot:scaffold4291_cov256-Pinguiococcus_pyrenoidosus.AAC.2
MGVMHTPSHFALRQDAQMRLLCYWLLLARASNASTHEFVVANTWTGAFSAATDAAWEALDAGGSRLDAVEAAGSTCERLQCDSSVGFGHHPDSRGKVSLDAMILDGVSMNAGAVGFLRASRGAIRVARAVLEHSSHTLLVGEGADSFADMLGLADGPGLDTEDSQNEYETWVAKDCQPNYYAGLPGCEASCPPYAPERFGQRGERSRRKSASRELFDTGDGDVMMRFAPAAMAVVYMRQGLPPAKACAEALAAISKFFPGTRFASALAWNGLAEVAHESELRTHRDAGESGGATHNMGFSYSVRDASMNATQQIPADIVVSAR